METAIVCAIISALTTLVVSIGTWHVTAKKDRNENKTLILKNIEELKDDRSEGETFRPSPLPRADSSAPRRHPGPGLGYSHRRQGDRETPHRALHHHLRLNAVMNEDPYEEKANVYVNVNSRSFDLAVIKEGELSFFNNFKFDTKDDFAYFLLFLFSIIFYYSPKKSQ